MVGTRGVPAQYGGFETCVEEVGVRLAAAGHDVVVYCRTTNGTAERRTEYRGMRLVHLPAVPKRSLETLSHTALSVGHLTTHPADAVLLFNAANAPLLPVLRARRLPVATHVDGLEWKRAKWPPMRAALLPHRRVAGGALVGRARSPTPRASGEYYDREFGAPTELIAYGAPIIEPQRPERLAEVDLEPRRLPPRRRPVRAREPRRRHRRGLSPRATRRCRSSSSATRRTPTSTPRGSRTRPTSACTSSVRSGTRRCSTSSTRTPSPISTVTPSAAPTRRCCGPSAPAPRPNAFSVSFNRDVLGDAGRYWSHGRPRSARSSKSAEADRDGDAAAGADAAGPGPSTYRWDDVAADYEKLCRRLAAREQRRSRVSGRRRTEHLP